VLGTGIQAQMGPTTGQSLETANEELKSSNEEYQSVNEEFQSTNEELESSKEELQSINEELNTINGELTAKNEALAEANSDIKNLLDSTLIATLFLDKDLRIRNFTPAMTEIFSMRAGDRGRPITDIVTRLSYPDLKRDVQKVLGSLSMIEHEVTIENNNATFLMRILPYRTVDDVIAGVVITFTTSPSASFGRKRGADSPRLSTAHRMPSSGIP
jgi:two-component system CheB/CheR fusion protein